jgi:hypothetical protein
MFSAWFHTARSNEAIEVEYPVEATRVRLEMKACNTLGVTSLLSTKVKA